MSIRRLNHAVLYVRDANRSKRFYTEVLGFRERANIGEQAYFLQADGSDNDHDLGLFEVGGSSRSARWWARATTASARACTPRIPTASSSR